MSAEAMGGSAGDAGSPALRRQTSLQHRQYVLCPSSAASTQAQVNQHQQHPPQEEPDEPWSEYDNSAASEVLQHDHDLNVLFHHQNRKQQQHRNFSDPICPASPAKYPQESISNVPVLSPVPISPRWESILTKSSVVTFDNLSSSGNTAIHEHTKNTPQRTNTDSSPTPRGTPRSAFPGLSSNPFIPEEPSSPPAFVTQSRKFPLFARGQNDAQRPPLTPTSTTSSGDSRPASRRTDSTERNMTVENFSRPRKPSVRSREPALPHAPTSHPYPEQYHDHSHNTQIHLNYNDSPDIKRTRGMSLSSAKSSSTLSSLRHRPSNDHLGPSSRADSLRRAETAGGSSVSLARQALSPNKNTTQPQNREVPPWVTSDDELRSSFRSQLTTSTAQGTLFTATERSSVLTGNSSITEQSIINGYARTSWRTNSMVDDGPSVEDVMGMYERGFNDSDIESVRRSMKFADDDDEDDAPERPGGQGGFGMETLRPTSSHSDVTGVGAKMLEAMNDPLPMPRPIPVSESRRSSARYSGVNFRFSLVGTSLPKDIGLGFAAGHFGRKKEADLNGPGKHDSGKMLDRDDVEQFTPRAGTSKPASPTKIKSPHHVSEMPVPEPEPESEPQPVNPTPAPQLPVEPPEVPGSRDRYGFKKATTNITREQYDSWDEGYTEYLARRRKKWVAFLKDNSLMTDRPNRFPPRNAKTKRFIRKGIPPDWRGAAWFYYAGGPAILSKHRGVYQGLVERAGLDPHGPGMLPGRTTEVKPLVVEDIEKDLHRTFPDNVRFKPPQSASPPPPPGDNGDPTLSRTKTGPEPEIIGSLRRLLHAFALYNPRIGYCQSLNFLAGMLLLFVDTEEQAFWLLNVITRVYLPGTHEMSLEGSKVDLGVLMTALKDSLPHVWKQIGGDEVEPSIKKGKAKRGNKSIPSNHTINDPNRLPAITLCMTAWFMSCFIGTLPTETVLRVWDVFFYEGSRTLFRIALTIFKLGEAEIKAVTDPMEMFGVVQAFPRRLIDCNALMDACYKRRNGIGHLSQEIVEAKRQERREGIRRWKAEQEAAALGSGDGHLENGANLGSKAAGLDLAGDPQEVRRKGTLFGRRPKGDREQTRAAEVM